MATRRKLMSGQCERDESLGKNKRKREGTNIDKGKENVVSNLIDEVEDDNLIGDSESTQSTRTPRGPTQMDRLAVQRHKGNKLHIQFNDLGQPIGKAATEMQSYIGVLARKKVKITYKSWKHVPNDVKDGIWETVNMVFNVDSTWKKGCLSSANEKWRQYKTHLTQDYIFPNLDNPEQLNKVPKDSCILPEDWSKFVMSRMADNFRKNSEKQQERRAKSLYPHRLSRKGYARFAEEVADELGDNDNDINRALLWMKGRLNKEGEFVGDQLKATATKIDEFIQQKKEGKLKYVDPKQDILTSALESKEHAGRVRAVGGYVTPTLYFNVAKGKPSVGKTEFVEQQKRLIDQEKKISEQEDRIQKLESMIYRNGLHDFENDERVGSCSVKFPPTMFANELKNGNFGPSNEISADSDDEDVKLINKADALQGKPVTLTLESGINVAFGTVVKVGGVGENINGAPLHKNCMGVSIDEALDESAALPVPNSSAYLSVGDAVGSHVAWPIHLIKTQDEKPRTKKVNHQEKRPRLQSPIVESSCLPKSLSMLYRYCKLALKGGEGIKLRLDYDVFGAKFVCHVHLEDIIPFCDLKPISYNCIVVYIWHLFRKMKEENKLERFRFVDPYLMGSHHTQMATRARGLASRLNDTLTNQLVLVPVNVGFHWILTVIDPHNELVYLLDPLSHRNRDEAWKNVVNMALKYFNMEIDKNGRKLPLWEIVKAPIQPDKEQCGFFIMRYMRQIIEGVASSDKTSLRKIFTKAEYSKEDIDEVRAEWAECLQDHIYDE